MTQQVTSKLIQRKGQPVEIVSKDHCDGKTIVFTLAEVCATDPAKFRIISPTSDSIATAHYQRELKKAATKLARSQPISVWG